MSNNLRTSLIRLAHQNPALRADLLPLLKEANYHPLNIRDQKIKFAYTKVNDGIVELVEAIEKNSDISPDYDLEKAMLKLSSAFNDVHVALATYAI